MENKTSSVSKTVIITGAARGIGLATAHLMHKAGWNIVLVDWDEEALAESAKAFENGIGLVCDVSEPKAVQGMIADALSWSGQIDALVNNAGIADFGPIEETDFERWRKVMATNLDGVFLVSQAAIPALKATGGAIVNIASVAGKEGNPNAAAYSASKAGVIGLTKSLGKELADLDIAVNCITPAAAKTAIFDQMTDEQINYMLSKIPRQRFVQTDEIAAMVAWLVCRENSFTTASTFDLSGGRATY